MHSLTCWLNVNGNIYVKGSLFFTSQGIDDAWSHVLLAYVIDAFTSALYLVDDNVLWLIIMSFGDEMTLPT